MIDLSKMVSLKKLTVHLTDASYGEANYVPWFNRIISSASGNPLLEEIGLEVTYVGDQINPTWWHGAFDALLQGGFKSLKRLNIVVHVEFISVARAYGNDLYHHERLQQLESQLGEIVDITSKCNALFSDSGPID